MNISSLYLRMVGIFILVVVTSLLLSTQVTRLLYGQDVLERLQRDSMIVGKQIVRYLVDNQVQDVRSYLDSSAVANTYDYYVFQMDELHAYENELPAKESIEQVLKGGVFRSEIYLSLQDPNKVIIGLPFQIAGEPYALFVKPNIRSMFSEFNQILPVYFVTVLIVGSLLILVVSSYFILPIRKMTLATRQVAQGDYQVQLQSKRTDEMGELAQSFNHMVMQLQKIEKMRQDFVSNVSHEFQSPLTSIRGFSQALMQQDSSAEDQKRFLHIILQESERLSKLTDNLLKLTSLESTYHPVHIEKYRLDEQLRQCVIPLEPQWLAKSQEVELKLVEAWIEADRDLLVQVWTNLISNAIKFTPENGKIVISLFTEEDEHVISVSDTGIGISPSERPYVFERFYKADRSRDRSISGNGLGLAIVQKIVHLHQGTIAISDHLPQGTTFTIRLPK